MKQLLRFEELAQFGLAVLLFSQLDYQWRWFPSLLLVPDLSIIGYLFGPKWGAWSYNFFHHKALGIMLIIIGFFLEDQMVELIGTILFAHSAFDRILSYGLKKETGFKDTHLERI